MVTAHEHFRQFGYEKATVAHIAKSIGVSAAYVYKFFGSKQAIVQAICRMSFERIAADIKDISVTQISAEQRVRLIFYALASHARELAREENQIRGLIIRAWQEHWQATIDYEQTLLEEIQIIVSQGRAAGEFERKTRINDTSRSVLLSMELLLNPLLWSQRMAGLHEQAQSLASLVLRSLCLSKE